MPLLYSGRCFSEWLGWCTFVFHRNHSMASSYRLKRFVLSFARLTRVWNLVIIAFAQYLTAGFLIDFKTIFDPRLFILTASTVMIAAGGYVINDYYDIKIDLINKPERVVVGKSITRRYAILFHLLLISTTTSIVGWSRKYLKISSAFVPLPEARTASLNGFRDIG